eukprot:gb/GECG01001631.1/.p1 GENE.gb/GECG01001631.1/~~gb/GECG01001631.1/.p1  ORF type:complete len:953 (+),score=112.35 gb/GECG01001631.1/:1-2859(+)
MAAAATNSSPPSVSATSSNAAPLGAHASSGLNGRQKRHSSEWAGSSANTVTLPSAAAKPGSARSPAFSESQYPPLEYQQDGDGGLNSDDELIGNSPRKKIPQHRAYKSTDDSASGGSQQQEDDDTGPDNILVRRASSAPQFADSSYRKHRSGERAEYLWKRGKYLRWWKKRWFVLNGNTLSYFKDESGMQLGEVDVRNASVLLHTKSTKEHIFELKLRKRSILLKARDHPSRQQWVSLLRRKVNSQHDFDESNPVYSNDNMKMKGSPKHQPSKIPSALEIEGLLEVGGELRVRSVDEPLDDFHLAWFTYTSDRPLSSHADISEVSAAKYIDRATAEVYQVREEDVGKRIGCTCRTVLGNERISTVTEGRVADIDKNVVTARIFLEPHVHNRYCDRRIRVCTAPGRYREHTVLKAILRGPSELVSQYKIRWYRSDVVAYNVGNGPSQSGGGSEAIDKTTMRMYHVRPRPVSHLPPAPSDSEPAPSIQEIRDKLKLEYSVSRDLLPRYSQKYPLFRDDIGRYIAFDIVPVDRPEEKDDEFDGVVWPMWGDQSKLTFSREDSTQSLPRNDILYSSSTNTDETGRVCSFPVGPVEAGPPKAREIWLEGDQRVDGVLIGHWYYFGGVEGKTQVWWIKITPSGEASNLTEPTCVAPGYKSPRRYSKALKVLDEGQPSVVKLTEEEEGCLIKFKVHPVREDGDEGHTESSRPTIEIASKSSASMLTRHTDPEFYDTHLQAPKSEPRVPKPPPPCPATVRRASGNDAIVPRENVTDKRKPKPVPKPPQKEASKEQNDRENRGKRDSDVHSTCPPKPPVSQPPSKRNTMPPLVNSTTTTETIPLVVNASATDTMPPVTNSSATAAIPLVVNSSATADTASAATEVEENGPLIHLWEAKTAPEGDTYYYHIRRGDTTWERPADFDTAVVRLPKGWVAQKDGEDRTHFRNTETGAVQWSVPEK